MKNRSFEFRNTANWKGYYSTNKWEMKTKACRRLTKYHCCVFWWKYAKHSHHLTYVNFEHEQPIRDIVPLSEFAHTLVHLPFLFGARKKNYLPRIISNWVLRFLYIMCIVTAFVFFQNKREIVYLNSSKKVISIRPKVKNKPTKLTQEQEEIWNDLNNDSE